MTESPILVLGARGKTGRRVTARLTALGVPVRAASRSTGTIFEWADRDTWGPALDGARAVYLVPMNESVDQDAVAEFADAAVAAGVRRLVLLAARGAGGGPQPAQEPAERAVRASGAEWTILRPAWFAQNFSEDFFREPLLAGVLALPTGEGREAFVDAGDIADVAVAALTGAGHAGEVYELSGPEPLTFGAAVRMIAEASGREIRYTPVEVPEFTAMLESLGVPAAFAEMLAGLLTTLRDGDGDRVGDGVRRALGRDPRPFAEYVKEAAAAGAWAAAPADQRGR
ncbi:NAD(P)H-binding protein [Actinomadura sp. WAC 06369]|uniref:NAD(P)H-binding protein n=1 Tax=Actinomadura sp. WAC 06369 TaxID=2203193 RepID=UPI000F78C192|nr:NAD(P)H-binding protein [Actinomadura sp. WAC 06369]RSN71373.1 NAD(P)-dependent oxidoreductase [Actinomadura sp. WAC 06369]